MNRLLRSFGYAFQGIGFAFRTQANLRIHAVISLAVVVAGLWLGLEAVEWATLVVTMMVVVAAELMNTAVEAALDRVSTDQHPLAKAAKDAAAGAVLIGAIGAVIVGALILGPRLLARLGG